MRLFLPRLVYETKNMSFIRSLHLQNFRSYAAARLDGIAPTLVVLTGPNGAGKTNVLEAVSLLTPGRGIRNAAQDEILCRAARDGWAVSAAVDVQGAQNQIGTAWDTTGGKRTVRINGAAAKSQIALSDYVSCLWLTPQMDRIFLDSAGGRRKFFDKLVFTFDTSHAGRVTRYENAMASRSKLLKDGKADPAWLKSLERQMAETGVAIAAARGAFLERLQKSCNIARQEEEHWFPKAQLSLKGTIEELLSRMPAVEVEELFLYQLEQSRGKDAETGGAATGTHKTDFAVRYAAKHMPADQCSTGEQKALLIGIVLAHARMMHGERGAPPILLLDEVAAHLDEQRRAALFDLLYDLGGQVWMTGTDESLFEAARDKAQFWHIESAKITKL